MMPDIFQFYAGNGGFSFFFNEGGKWLTFSIWWLPALRKVRLWVRGAEFTWGGR